MMEVFPEKVLSATDSNITEDSYSATHAGAVYFFCEPLIDLDVYPGANVEYQHCIVSLAEGLSALGYTCYGNTDYWQAEVDAPYLIQEKSVHAHDIIAYVVSSHWLLKQNSSDLVSKLPSDMLAEQSEKSSMHKPTFLMADKQEEMHRLLALPYLYRFEKVLLAGYVSSYTYPKNVIPWAFGLSNRILKEIERHINTTQRNNEILFNFRMGHSSRQLAEKHLQAGFAEVFEINNKVDNTLGIMPYDVLMDRQTGRRHYPEYYRTLCSTRALAAFGGYFVASITKDRYSLLNKVGSFIIRAQQKNSTSLAQHDSWRFWEGLVAGNVVFHSDLDECHVSYPVRLENFVHYIGVPRRFFGHHNPQDFLKFLEAADYAAISKQARDFALAHYAPIPVAQRFLEMTE